MGSERMGETKGRRSYLEETDDLRRENRHRLWPYCSRFDESVAKLDQELARRTLPKLPKKKATPLPSPRDIIRCSPRQLPALADTKESQEIADLEAELRLVEQQLERVRIVKIEPTFLAQEKDPFYRTLARRDAELKRKADAAEAELAANNAMTALAAKSREMAFAQLLAAGVPKMNLDRLLALAAATAAQASKKDWLFEKQQKQRNALAAQHIKASEKISCPHCQRLVPLNKLRQHSTKYCPNRLQPCKNHAHGCKVLVRPYSKHFHENADHLLKARSCLDCAQSGYISIDEAPLEPPWTLEFWLWRPSHRTALTSLFLQVHTARKQWLTAENKAAIARDLYQAENGKISDLLLRLAENWAKARIEAAVARFKYFEVLRAARRHLTALNIDTTQEMNADILHPQADHTPAYWSQLLADIEDNDSPCTEVVLIKYLEEMERIQFTTRKGKVPESTDDDTVSVASTQKSKKSLAATRQSRAKEKRAKMRAKRKAKLQSNYRTTRTEKHGLTVEERIDAALRGLAGRGTLIANEAMRIVTDLDQDDQTFACSEARVGICLPGNGSFFVSNATIPREKWVHLALVAKRGLRVYIDDEEMSLAKPFQNKKVTLNLPMRDLLGSRDDMNRGFEGLVLETRLWATARTAAELRSTRSTLPPNEARGHGLIAWWTYEEGQGKYLYDRSECRYRNILQGKLQWTDALQATGNQEPPTPASLERGICKVELQRARLALKGREMYLLTECRNYCGAQVMRLNMRFHLEFECPNRSIVCTLCGESIPFSRQTIHLRGKNSLPECPVAAERERLVEHHQQMPILSCDFGCNKRLRRCEMERHCRTECPMRLVDCPQNCGLKIAFDRLPNHCRFFCSNPFYVAARNMAQAWRHKVGYRRAWAEILDHLQSASDDHSASLSTATENEVTMSSC